MFYITKFYLCDKMEFSQVKYVDLRSTHPVGKVDYSLYNQNKCYRNIWKHIYIEWFFCYVCKQIMNQIYSGS